jgi:hypothetical protein
MAMMETDIVVLPPEEGFDDLAESIELLGVGTSVKVSMDVGTEGVGLEAVDEYVSVIALDRLKLVDGSCIP